MVWVVEGTLQSPPDVTVESVPDDTSHWLRPNRRYRAGRQGGLRAAPKPGSGKAPPATKPRPYDFRIASLKISKEGLIDLETGGADWDPADRQEDATNLEPYPLVAIVRHKKSKLVRGAGSEPVPLPVDESGVCKVAVQDGDCVKLDCFHLRFTWQPVVLCFPAAKAEQKSAVYAVAKILGIKVAYGETLDHHTHYIVKKTTPNKLLLTAAARPVHVVSPTWFDALRIASKPPDPPSGPAPEPPAPRQPGEEAALYDKRVLKYERELLALDSDVGSDVPRWWGHSLLEKNWEAAWPAEADARYYPTPWQDDEEPGIWKKNVARRTVFQNRLFASFSGSIDADDKNATIVQLAGGHFFTSGVLQHSPLPEDATELVKLICEYKSAAKVPDQANVVIIPPPNLFTDETQGSLEQTEELDQQSLKQRDLLLDLQEELGAALISSEGAEIAKALCSLDSSALLGGASPGSNVRRMPSSGAALQSSAGLVDATPPFPTGGVPGTHPDSIIPTASMLNVAGADRTGRVVDTQSSRGEDSTQGQARGEAGPSTLARKETTQAEAEPAPTAPKKLVRRARTGRTAVLDLLDDPAEEAESRSVAPRYLTQDFGDAGSQSGGSTSTPFRATVSPAPPDGADANNARAGTSAGLSRAGRLNRRAGQKSAVQAFIDDDDGDARIANVGGGSGTSQSQSGDRRRATKSKEERLREIREEDERRAKEEGERYQQRKEQEANAAQTSKSGRSRQRGAAPMAAAAGKKRDKSAALSDDGNNDDGAQGLPRRKLDSRKDGDAPVSTTNKRSRDMLRAAEDSSTSDEDVTNARKKSRGPAGTESPKSKKEAAAQKKAAKEAEALDRKRLLQVKTSKRKGAELDKELNDDFNALKIVKPVMKAMPPVDKHRMAWDEEDSDAERDRLIRAAQERAQHGASDADDNEMDPSRWRQATQAMFVVRPLHIEPKYRRDENEPPRDDPRWAGKANFKRFRPKNSGAARAPRSDRHEIKLVLPEAVDFGLGEGYGDRKGTAISQLHPEDEDEDADIFSFAGRDKGQTKLAFGSDLAAGGKKQATTGSTGTKAKNSTAKGKGKGKQVVVDSEEESEAESSHTLDGDNRVMDIDELDDEDTPLQPTAGYGKRGNAASGRGTSRTGRSGGTRKIPSATVMIDDSDSDSDSGLTFKGFGKKAAGASSARRRM